MDFNRLFLSALLVGLSFEASAQISETLSFNPSAALEAVHGAVRESLTPEIPAAPAVSGVGFETGNEFTAVPLEGYASVTCHDRGHTEYASFACSGEILDPAEFVRFQGPAGVDADRVELEATWANGRGRKKSERYNASVGTSGHFNLWIATLLQRPLLDVGANRIRYSMTKAGRPAASGEFTATVSVAPRRVCTRRGHYTSHRPEDCRAGTTSICGQYFQEENYCR